MTTISGNPAATIGTQFAASAELLGNSAQLMGAAGILASAVRPLNAGPLALAALPAAYLIQMGKLASGALPSQIQPVAAFTAQVTGQHTAKVDLGDGYRLEIDERSSEMTIFNDKTGQRTRVWGDPHVDVNGKHQFDFYGTTTFELDNGTKLTINTEAAKGNPNVYYAAQVVVTRGDNAVVIDGLSQNQLGDLSVSVSTNGAILDAAHRDGFTVHESAAGWRTELDTLVTQKEADITRPGALYGPGSDAPSLAEAGQAIGSFLFFGAVLGVAVDAASRSAAREVAGAALLRHLLVG